MEGKEAIIEQILLSARSSAKNVVAQAESARDEQIENAVKEIESIGKQTVADARDDAEAVVVRRVKLAELDARKQVLSAKQEALEKTYAQAVVKLSNMADNVYRDFIERLILRYAEKGDEIVIAARDAKRLNNEFVKRINGKSGLGLTLSKRNHGATGGVVLSNAKCEKNLTLETLVLEARAETESAVCDKLFRRK